MPDFIDLRGTRTACEVAGSGPPLLMLHGGEGSRRQFHAVRPELEPHFTVISYDQRDCGDTVNPDMPNTLETLADDALALLQALGQESAHVFGASFGGRVAQALAVCHPQAVRRLVLASTWPLPVSLAQANPEVAQALGRLRAQLPDSAEQIADIFYPAAFLAAQPACRAHFKSAPARSERTDRRSATLGDVPAGLDISAITQPTLLITGDLDRVVPHTLTLSLSQHLSDTRAVVLPGVGHLTLAQAPAAVAAHVREFLS